MKDIHDHLKKLRSDAAECLVLSNLAPEGKGMMFTRIAEHLNALARDIEKSATSIGADSSDIRKPEEIVNAAVSETQPLRPRRTYLQLGLLGLGVFSLGALFGVTTFSGNAAQYWSSVAPNQERQVISKKTSNQVGLVSAEQAERKMLLDKVAAFGGRLDKFDDKLDALEKNTAQIETLLSKESPVSSQLGAFGGTMDNLDRKMDNLGKATTEIAKMLTTATVSPEGRATGSEGIAAPGIGRSATTAENNTALDEPAQVKPSDSIGPRGCTQFRSFDPKSGSYVTLDGRRRPCR